ncbi:hypothetical protein Taro_038929, partial [Colocasia esculenta]|nr:hypothetical protein [Colocasia esculenta]
MGSRHRKLEKLWWNGSFSRRGGRMDLLSNKGLMRSGMSRNNPQKTTELFSFGRPKEEKTRSRLHPLCEATTSTRPYHSLGTGSTWSTGDPLHRQRESGGVREHPRDPVTTRKRTVHSSLLAITVGQLLPLWSYCGQVDGRRSCRLS